MRLMTTKIVALVLLVAPLMVLGGLGFVFLASRPPSRPNSPWLVVIPISQIPADGRPVFLPVGAPRYDAWTRIADEVVGHVYAHRDLITSRIQVISAVHGRLTVPVDYDQQTGCFVSRCFAVRFDINGTVIRDRNTNSSNEDGIDAVDFRIVDDVLFVRNAQS